MNPTYLPAGLTVTATTNFPTYSIIYRQFERHICIKVSFCAM